MSSVFSTPGLVFSTQGLAPGQSTAPITLPNTLPGSTDPQSRVFWLRVMRDGGAADPDANQPATVTISQGGVVLRTIVPSDWVDFVGTGVFQPDPHGGPITILNGGPGTIASVEVHSATPR